jgi:hypothetical protein
MSFYLPLEALAQQALTFHPRADSPTAYRQSGKTLDQFRAEGYTVEYTFTGSELVDWIQGWRGGQPFTDHRDRYVTAGSKALMKPDGVHGVFVECLNLFALKTSISRTTQPDDLMPTQQEQGQFQQQQQQQQFVPIPQAQPMVIYLQAPAAQQQPVVIQNDGGFGWGKVLTLSGIIGGSVVGGALIARRGGGGTTIINQNTNRNKNKIIVVNPVCPTCLTSPGKPVDSPPPRP